MIKKQILVPIIMFIITIFITSTGCAQAYLLDVKVPSYNFQAQRISDIAIEITNKFGIPLCVEEVLGSDGEFLKGDLIFSDVITFEEMLNKLVESFPIYIWKLDHETGVINIYPKQNSPLGWNVVNVDLDNVQVKDIIFGEINEREWFWDEITKNHISIHFESLMVEMNWLIMKNKKRISVKGEDIPIRKIINLMFSGKGNVHVWAILPDSRPVEQRLKGFENIEYDLFFMPVDLSSIEYRKRLLPKEYHLEENVK